MDIPLRLGLIYLCLEEDLWTLRSTTRLYSAGAILQYPLGLCGDDERLIEFGAWKWVVDIFLAFPFFLWGGRFTRWLLTALHTTASTLRKTDFEAGVVTGMSICHISFSLSLSNLHSALYTSHSLHPSSYRETHQIVMTAKSWPSTYPTSSAVHMYMYPTIVASPLWLKFHNPCPPSHDSRSGKPVYASGMLIRSAPVCPRLLYMYRAVYRLSGVRPWPKSFPPPRHMIR